MLEWYDRHGRSLPWRETRDPYAIWVSEVMLQQTQVATVLPYYERWMARFPTAASLAEADDQDILAHWQGLGYYRRCRNLVAGVRKCVNEGFPKGLAAWRAMPGVGDYTAAALASILDGEATPVVDGNVERVYARVCADPATGDARRKAARAWAQELISHERPGDWNQAIMEIGATVCRPRNPTCPTCPLQNECEARRTNRVLDFPTPKPRPETLHIEQRVGVWTQNQNLALIQAEEGEWWTGLWILPQAKGKEQARIATTVTRHRVTLIAVEPIEPPPDEARWIGSQDLADIPIPAPFRKLLAKLGF